MKILFQINLWSISITILLYLTIWGGILSQTILGGIQILCFLVLLFKYNSISNKNLNLLALYGILTITLITVCLIDAELVITLLWPVSGLLAFFFLWITWRIKNNNA